MKKGMLAAALMALALPAMGQVDARLAKDLKASYARVVAALKKQDVKGVMNQMTPDATMKEMGRTMTRAEFEGMLKQQIHMMQVQSAEITFTKASAKGSTANAEYTEKLKARVTAPNGKSGLMASAAKYRAIFKKVGGAWKLHYSEALGTPQMTLDGKPVTMGGPPR